MNDEEKPIYARPGTVVRVAHYSHRLGGVHRYGVVEDSWRSDEWRIRVRFINEESEIFGSEEIEPVNPLDILANL